MKVYDLIGVGIGPFNLSLAALLPKDKLDFLFLDDKPEFSWHSELMFDDAEMQTSFLKDLVTPVDPTSPYTFLNYLNQKGQFYHFLNTDRKTITRMEFEDYCKWAVENLSDYLKFNSKVLSVKFKDDLFAIETKDETYFCKDLCVASGPQANIPECATPFLGGQVFHAKSKELQKLDLRDKRLTIIGGGQTGIEIFRNAMKSHFGKARSIELISGRDNLRPLDEGPFTNEIFTPEFVENFYELDQATKDDFSEKLLLASDGNTPGYLRELYNEMYLEKFYNKNFPDAKISPSRWLESIEKTDHNLRLTIKNKLANKNESIDCDIVILATGFKRNLPPYLESLSEYLEFAEDNRAIISKDYKLKTKLNNNTVYTMNYSAHRHGIADPQTSLMSWRSAVIVNSLLKKSHYKVHQPQIPFLNFFS